MGKLTNEKLITLQNLTDYNTKLKTYISDQAGSAAAAAIKTVAYDTTTQKLLFYKELAADVTVGTTTPVFSQDLKKVATTGAAEDLSIKDTAGIITATDVEGALAELMGAINTLNGAVTAEGSVAKKVKDAIDALDTTTDVTIASVASDVVTIKAGVAEVDGVIAQGSGSDIVLAKAAKTGAAADISIADAGNIITATDVEGALQEIVGGLGSAAAKDAKTTAMSDADAETATLDEDLVNAAQVVTYVKGKVAGLTGAMHFTYSVTPTTGQTDAQAIAAAYTAASATPAKGDFVVITTNSKEYVYDGSAWVELGDESLYVTKATTIAGVDLQDNITKAEMLTALNVADGAQVNVLEGVQVNGSDLTVDTNKKVNVTVAEGATNGTVAVNGTDVAVHGLGSMAYETATDYVTEASVTLATKAEVEALLS